MQLSRLEGTKAETRAFMVSVDKSLCGICGQKMTDGTNTINRSTRENWRTQRCPGQAYEKTVKKRKQSRIVYHFLYWIVNKPVESAEYTNRNMKVWMYGKSTCYYCVCLWIPTVSDMYACPVCVIFVLFCFFSLLLLLLCAVIFVQRWEVKPMLKCAS